MVTPFDLFEPEGGDGIRISPGLKLIPTAEIDAAYDDNIYNSNLAKVDDLVASFRPRLNLRTDLPRHQFSLSGGADVRSHASVTEENSEQFDIQAKGILDLAERTEVIADAGFQRGVEQRGTSGDQFLTDEPVTFDREFAGLLVQRQGGFLDVVAEGRISETSYRDTRVGGIALDLSDRNSTVKRARIRGSMPSSHYSRVFVEASINQVSYENSTPIERDSAGYALLAGMHLQLTNLAIVDVGVGYVRQDFDNSAFKSVSAVNYHLQAKWTPRPDWHITAAANRTIDPSPSLSAPAIVRSDFLVRADKAIGARTLVSAEVGFVDESYEVSGRKDQRFHASVSPHYRLTDKVGLVASASWRHQNGNALGRDYDGVAATVGARWRF